MRDSKAKMGRPKKLEVERVHVNVYLNAEVLKALDDYVHQQKQEVRGYSRSDFIEKLVGDTLLKTSKASAKIKVKKS
jgi:hypothetical protein